MAKELRRLGVKGILITAAEQGHITDVKCGMPKCHCPEELGGASHFDPVTEYSDWNPTHEHYRLSSSFGGDLAGRLSGLSGRFVLAGGSCVLGTG